MRNRHVYIGLYLLETLLFLACVAGIAFFIRVCEYPLDLPFLLLWGAVLLVLLPLLIRGEIRLYREEGFSGDLFPDDKRDGE